MAATASTEPLCCMVTADQMALVDHYRGDVSRERWLRALIDARLIELDHRAVVGYAKSIPEEYSGFIGAVVAQVPPKLAGTPVRGASKAAASAHRREDTKRYHTMQTREAELGPLPAPRLPTVTSDPSPEMVQTIGILPDSHQHVRLAAACTRTAIRYRCADATCAWVSDWEPR